MTTEIESKLLEKAADDLLGIDSLTAAQLKERVDKLLKSIGDNEWELGKRFVQLGNALLKVRQTKAWENWGFESFGGYIDSIRSLIDKGRTQLYATISVAEKLLPVVGEAKLEQMGITKAAELKKAVVDGKVPSDDLINKALDPKTGVKELRAGVFKETKQPENEKGVYHDWGGAYLTPEEKTEFDRAFAVAEKELELKPDIPNHIRTKEVFLAFAREFLSTYEKPVNDAEKSEDLAALLDNSTVIEPEYLEEPDGKKETS